MSSGTNAKFSPIALDVKKNIRRLRLQAGYSMNEGARLLNISRKQLEDIETGRNYGCHIELELIAKIKVVYSASIDELIGDPPSDTASEYYSRPRQRIGSRSRQAYRRPGARNST